MSSTSDANVGLDARLTLALGVWLLQGNTRRFLGSSESKDLFEACRLFHICNAVGFNISERCRTRSEESEEDGIGCSVPLRAEAVMVDVT